MFENFDKKYESVTKLFEGLIQNTNFSIPNSIILYGSDIIAQYYFALMLARGANCTGDKTQNCQCQNCRWIMANEHPEVMTISKINSKPEGDDSKTVISVKQTDIIKDKLVISSDYHRFFIFCDAEKRQPLGIEKEQFDNFGFINQKLPYEPWVPLGITKNCFSDVVANSLLKSVEEPPSSVTFIFLTENIENIISTIVSRSQVFYIPNFTKENYDYSFVYDILQNYPYIDSKQAIIISQFLQDYSNDTKKTPTEILTALQMYFKDMIKENRDNLLLKKMITETVNNLEKIVLMTKAGVKEQAIFDETGYVLTK